MEISKMLMRDAWPKNIYSLSELASSLGLNTSQIEAWESEFPQVRLKKSIQGIRIYDRDDIILFSQIKYLVCEKKLTIPLVLKQLAETDDVKLDARQEQKDNLFLNDYKEDPLWDTSHLLPEPEEEGGFDETTNEIYQECATAIDEAKVIVPPEEVGQMLKDAFAEEQRKQLQAYKLQEYERELRELIDKRKSLHELLGFLEKYEPFAISDKLKI